MSLVLSPEANTDFTASSIASAAFGAFSECNSIIETDKMAANGFANPGQQYQGLIRGMAHIGLAFDYSEKPMGAYRWNP